MGDKHPVSVRHGQTCFFMVFHTMLRQISNFCFCAISLREFLSALFFTFFYPKYEKDVLLFSFTCITSTFRQACLLSFPRWEQLPNGIPHLTINISFHRRFPFLSNLINVTKFTNLKTLKNLTNQIDLI